VSDSMTRGGRKKEGWEKGRQRLRKKWGLYGRLGGSDLLHADGRRITGVLGRVQTRKTAKRAGRNQRGIEKLGGGWPELS